METKRATAGQKVLLAVLAGVVVLGLGIGLVVSMKSPEPARLPSEPVAAVESQPVAAQIVIDVTPRELANAYDGNELVGDSTYKDKTVEITGTVRRVEKFMRHVVVHFKEARVAVELLDGEESTAMYLKANARAKIRGVVKGAGAIGGVRVKDGEIVEHP